MGNILIIEDNTKTRLNIENIFSSTEHKIYATGKTEEADDILYNNCIDVVLLDIEINGVMSGIDYISAIHRKKANTQIIMVSKHNNIKNVIEATKKGAFYYITKPFNPQEILLLTEKALDFSSTEKKAHLLEKENTLLMQRLTLSEKSKKYPIISQSVQLKKIKAQLKQVNEFGVDSNILLWGESGSGKEVFAKFINRMTTEKSNRETPFIAVNCTSIPENLFEAEFFGHEKGAFTGANKLKHGYFELAEGGHIFLDEIGDMPMDFQVKLLRVLQEKQVRRVGGTKSIPCNFKLICATNQNLKQRISDGLFREDLFYRISTIDIYIPPLRERPEDIPILVDYFISEINQKSKIVFPPLDKKIVDLLAAYHWPGNVRELKNTIKKLLVLGFDGKSYKMEILLDTITNKSALNQKMFDSTLLKTGIGEKVMNFFDDIRTATHVDYRHIMATFEKMIIQEALSSSGNNGMKAAKLLGLSKSTFYSRWKMLK